MYAFVSIQRAGEESHRGKPVDELPYIKALKAEAAFLEQASTRTKRQSASLKRLRAKMELAIDARASAIADTEAFQRDRAE